MPQDQASLAVEPREGPLDDPSMASQSLLGLDAPARDPRDDAAHAARLTALPRIVPFVGVHLVRALSRATAPPPAQRRHRIEQLLEQLTVVEIGFRQSDRERDPLGVDHKMALAARTALVRWIRARDVAPLFAATVELSMATRLQSISSAHANSCKSTAWSRRQRPRRVHVRNRRQQVEPLPQPSSSGSSCHGSPVRRTKTMPVNTWRLLTRGRPPFAPGPRSLGRMGATTAHNASSTRGFMSHTRF